MPTGILPDKIGGSIKMGTITCRNGSVHTHRTSDEVRACYSGALVPAHTSSLHAGSGPSASSSRPAWMSRPVSDKQLWKIEELAGKNAALVAKHLDRGQASSVIEYFLHPNREATPVTSTPPVPTTPPARPVDPRHAMIAGLLTMVPDGYYAVTPDGTDAHVTFLRISRPKKDKYRDAIKVQTVHGSFGKPRLSPHPIAALWPSGMLSVYAGRGTTEDDLLLLVADYQGALRRYAKLIGHCCRCNASLTDDRSRHYGIGPECEKHMPDIIEAVDMEEAIAAAEAAL